MIWMDLLRDLCRPAISLSGLKRRIINSFLICFVESYFLFRSTALTKVINSRVQTRVSVFPIHIVRAAARIILNPDTKVLHVRRVLLSELSIKEIKLNYAYRSLLPLSLTSLTSRISPVVFFIFLIWCIKYQNRDFAITSLGANSFIRYAGGFSSLLVGAFLPTT